MEDLVKISCPPCKRIDMPSEVFVLPESIAEYDVVHAAFTRGEHLMAAAQSVAMRARDAEGRVLFGKAKIVEWPRGMKNWLFQVAAAIAESDKVRDLEEEQGN